MDLHDAHVTTTSVYLAAPMVYGRRNESSPTLQHLSEAEAFILPSQTRMASELVRTGELSVTIVLLVIT